MNQDIIISAKFVSKKTGRPVSSSKYWSKVMAKGFFKDCFLDMQNLDDEGKIKGYSNLDLTGNVKPDIYFELYFEDKKVFKSRVYKKSDFLKGRRISNHPFALDFGTIQV